MMTALTLPRYQSRKIVGAARIVEVIYDDEDNARMGTLLLDAGGQIVRHRVEAAWIMAHEAEIGDYYVQMPEMALCCPADVFDEEYEPMLRGPTLTPAQLAEKADNIELYAGAQWNDDTLARLRHVMDSKNTLVGSLNRLIIANPERFPAASKEPADG